VTALDIDLGFLRQVLLELLDIPSPTGRTDHVQQYVGERLDRLGVPFVVTRRGAIVAELGGPASSEASRAVVVHTDTIGAMIRNLKSNGRLELKPVGHHSARHPGTDGTKRSTRRASPGRTSRSASTSTSRESRICATSVWTSATSSPRWRIR